jgi:hypothetical protein
MMTDNHEFGNTNSDAKQGEAWKDHTIVDETSMVSKRGTHKHGRRTSKDLEDITRTPMTSDNDVVDDVGREDTGGDRHRITWKHLRLLFQRDGTND